MNESVGAEVAVKVAKVAAKTIFKAAAWSVLGGLFGINADAAEAVAIVASDD